VGERILLAWLNYCYANYKHKIWSNSARGGAPPNRYFINFDIDLTDSLAIASVIGAYCPYMIDSHLSRMYVLADTAEKCFHNALILVECSRELGLDYDVNSLDITDPNSISMVLFVAFLFNKLSNFVPSANIEFNGPLHTTVSKQIKITNPIAKNIFYEALIIGPNRESFTMPKGKELPIAARGRANLAIDYQSDNMKPAVAFLILAGKKNGSYAADPIVFNLKANINELTAKKIVKFQSPLYKQNDSRLDIENPYEHGGEFKIRILETGEKSYEIQNPFHDGGFEKQSNLAPISGISNNANTNNTHSSKPLTKQSIESQKQLKNP
jgi:hypothetical protein